MHLNSKSEYLVKKAQLELNETEIRKQQSLCLFRDWLDKHPFISNIKPADEILLALLRTKKYSMEKAYDAFEKLAIVIATQPEFQQKFKSKNICGSEKNLIFVLKERDQNGCRNVLIDPKYCDAEHWDVANLLWDAILTNFALCSEDETQICGINYIIDMRMFSMQHISKSLNQNAIILCSSSRYSFLRIRKITFVGLPAYAAAGLNFFKNCLSEKLRKRVEVVDALDFEVTEEMIEDVRGKCNKHAAENLMNLKVDLDAMKKCRGDETFGTFRKLEID